MNSDRNTNETDEKLLEAYRQNREANIPDLWDRISEEVDQLPPEEKKPAGTLHKFPQLKVWIPVAACFLILLIPLSLHLLRGGNMSKSSSSKSSSDTAQMEESVEQSEDSSDARVYFSEEESSAETNQSSSAEASSAKQETAEQGASTEGLTVTGTVEEIGEDTVVLTVDSVAGKEGSESPVIEAGERITIQYTGKSPLDVQAGQQVSAQMEKEEDQIYYSQKIEKLP